MSTSSRRNPDEGHERPRVSRLLIVSVVGALVTVLTYAVGEAVVGGSTPGAQTSPHSNVATKSHHESLAMFSKSRPTHRKATSSTTSTTSTSTTMGPTSATSFATAVGTPDSSSSSGMAPPGATALPGYTLSYVSDFAGSSLPSGWDAYNGKPGGDPGGQFASSHVVVGGGLLQLNTWRDPAYGNAWVTGGLCQCGRAQTYGAYFVRTRVTGAGPTAVELLWPAANVWPPEIDFNETGGGAEGTSATVHFDSTNHTDQRTLAIDMTQWHTWGVIWTSSSIVYTVDGRVWGTVAVASEVPQQAMTLDLQQQTWCSSGWACPTTPQSMQIDWVAEYTAS